jgi:hypothetical protein
MLNKKALAASVSAPPAIYPEDVFSTFLYTGNGSTQTITNGIDLAGEGGLVWQKVRSTTGSHFLADTNRGNTKYIQTEATGNEDTVTTRITSFNSDGFSIGDAGSFNTNSNTYATWTFRKAPKFFDVVTYTGNGVAFRTGIPHNLGSTPGMIIVKKIDNTSDWKVWHRSLGFSNSILLNSTAAANSDTASLDDARYQGYIYSANSTTFATDAGSSDNVTQINENGATYVAYLFAHDAGGFGESGTDNVISCGSFVGGTTNTINLGYEPQYILYKASSDTSAWRVIDTMRGLKADIGSGDGVLSPNTSDAETSHGALKITSTGFEEAAASGITYIYMAIRRPMKVPTTGTEVFAMDTLGATSPTPPGFNASFPVDLGFYKNKASGTGIWFFADRLRGATYLSSNSTAAETAESLFKFDYQNGWSADSGVSTNIPSWMFRRAPNFFDVVCYTGTGTARTVAHNLGVAPELMIVKCRSTAGTDWQIYSATLGATHRLEFTSGGPSTSIVYWNNTAPTSSVFTVGTSNRTNESGDKFVAYLFASCPGVSKVGSYTGNGSSQTINCGFTAGARFVMVKRTDSTGDWVVLDTARGIVSGNDPFLQLNLTAVEVTGEDIVDPDSSGFIVNSTTENINASGGTYIFLAIA